MPFGHNAVDRLMFHQVILQYRIQGSVIRQTVLILLVVAEFGRRRLFNRFPWNDFFRTVDPS